MLLRVTVPKRTGRKRKRGSQDPFVDDSAVHSTSPTSPSGSLDAKQLISRLRDNIGRYEVEVVGQIEKTHVFRGKCYIWVEKQHSILTLDTGIPDFVYSTTASPFMNRFRENILPFEC